ncbi:MAG TPA: TrkA C-terminal domain-containing protein, partial [Pricia sp.]|nr:TrkA C-terminal domain-containing protein [Pricia sp.]
IHTGLSTDIARFQARSAYTGAGFTSNESEKIMNHPVRRKIIFTLMLVGNAGIVTVMSSLILTFVLPNTLATKLYGLLIVVVGMTLIWWAIKSKWIDRRLSKIINRMLVRYTDLEVKDFAAILHLKDDFKISEKRIAPDDWMANRTLLQLNLREEGITVLGIDRDNYEYFGSPSGEFEILPDDVVTIYGKADGIRSVYNRKKNYKAEHEHEEHVRKEETRQNVEEERQKEDQAEGADWAPLYIQVRLNSWANGLRSCC